MTLVNAMKRKATSKTKEGKEVFDWELFGRQASVCFKAVPAQVRFLIGPLSSQSMPKIRRYQKRVKRGEEETLEEQVVVPSEHQDAPKLSDPAAPVSMMKKELKKQCSATAGDNDYNEIDMIPFLVDPNSFAQTVENFFHFSFLVKRGAAGVRTASDGTVYIRPIKKRRDEAEMGTVYAARQAVMSLTMKDWRGMVDAYNLKSVPDDEASLTLTNDNPLAGQEDPATKNRSVHPEDTL
jgi:non-structural maintenance of chromosomes element 4